MDNRLAESFFWVDFESLEGKSGEEQYQRLCRMASEARGRNPAAFDRLIDWMLEESRWSEEKLAENGQLLQGIFNRFRQQNARLRELLERLRPLGLVNGAVWKAIDRFEEGLCGHIGDEGLQPAVRRMLADFSALRERSLREQIAGDKTGPYGTGHVSFFGYLSWLKDLDAQLQWALFMPDVVKRQQRGFRLESFSYQKMSALRFIGREEKNLTEEEKRKLFLALDALAEYRSGFDYDLLFMHHDGLCVDIGPRREFWGRFMKADTPVPEGMVFFDFLPENDKKEGPPFFSQFACAVFSGDKEAMHRRDGFDSDAMYDITRNTMLGQGVNIPYPDKYWTAEVFLNGYASPGSAYLFSAQL